MILILKLLTNLYNYTKYKTVLGGQRTRNRLEKLEKKKEAKPKHCTIDYTPHDPVHDTFTKGATPKYLLLALPLGGGFPPLLLYKS